MKMNSARSNARKSCCKHHASGVTIICISLINYQIDRGQKETSELVFMCLCFPPAPKPVSITGQVIYVNFNRANEPYFTARPTGTENCTKRSFIFSLALWIYGGEACR